ncbi:hypothetical protein CA267_001725 [Alteromonas pelagimontana]|uniref:Bacteriophage tail tape measure C-terminal domain-containing protein n=1 Tax=Alteromonas pelagimontana TaxID=1858656 RepID=A0A6M4M9D6_9ALTE|nr:hypothetical protein [Alteromonas pelagimontana]QJR79290.1 hypothetical protein CA267_001725 [Alteromonas pelagimontana]
MNKYEFIISAKDKTAQAFQSIHSGLSGVTNAAKASAAAVAGVAVSFGALTVNAVRNAKELDALSKVAGYGVEEFQALSYAFDQFNISQEKFADISKDVQDKLGDFLATGGGEFADFFEKVAPQVGLTADALKDLSGTDVLIAVKKAMDDANVSAKEQVFYMESIANDATLLLPALKNNGEAVRRYAEEFRGLNAAMSQSELNTMKEVANDFARVEASLTGVGNKIAFEFSPYIQAATDLLVDATKESNGFAKEIKEGFEAAEDIIITTAGAISIVTSIMGDAYDGYRTLPGWMQEIGLAGAFIGGKKGLAVIAATGKALDGVKNTAEWLAAYTTGQISFAEWISADNEEAAQKLDELKESLAGFGEQASNMPDVSFGDTDSWFNNFSARVDKYKQKRNEVSGGPEDEKKPALINVTRAEREAKQFLTIVDLLNEVNGNPIQIDTEFSGLDSASDWLPKDLNINLPVSGRFDFDDTFKSSAENYWGDINDNGFLNLKPTVDLTEASAANQSLIDSAASTFEQIHEERLRFAGLDEQIEEERYQRQLTRMQDEIALIEKKGLLTQELEEEYRQAQLDAEENHASRMQEIKGGFWEKWLEAAEENLTNFDELSQATIETFSGQMGSALESVMFDSESTGDAIKGIIEGMARSTVSALGAMAAQWLAYKAVQLLVGKSTAVAGASGLALNAQASSLMAGLNAFTSTAAIPIVGPFAAPAAMGAALAVTQPMAAAIGGLAASAAVASYDGGGYTGDGIRAGGLDGKGGMLAMVHPQEYVTDFTKGQRLGATSGMSISVTNHLAGSSDDIYAALERQPKRLKRMLNKISNRPIA